MNMLAATAAFTNFNLHSTHSAVHHTAAGTAYSTTQHTYYSDPIELKAGHMIFTNPWKTPLKMPTGRYALTYFIGDIVYADSHEPAPLSEVYDHHWIAKASNHVNQLCQGGLAYVFGIGAESRNNPVTFPTGFGYFVPSGTSWGANIHLLRTEGLAGDNPYKAAKECNECYWALGKGQECTPARNGTFQCCGDGDYQGVMTCPTAPNPPPPRSYRLRYTFNYTTELDSITPVQVGTMAAPHCSAFYEALRDDANPVHHVHYQFTNPVRSNVLFATGHQHVGALNISMSVNGQRVCTSYPTYGTQPGVAGDEKGYLVAMSPCLDPSTPQLELHKGDVISIDGLYHVGSHDPRLLYSDGTHLNVMSYMYVAYYRPKESVEGGWDEEWWRVAAGEGVDVRLAEEKTEMEGRLALPLDEMDAAATRK